MERESLEMDVVFVGAGPANLSGALPSASIASTTRRSKERKGEPLGEIQIAVIERALRSARIRYRAMMDPPARSGRADS